MTDVFCKIIQGEIKADIVAEGENWIAFRDIHPKAPIHVLIVPKKHISKIEGAKEDKELMGELVLAVQEVAEKMGIASDGYRLILNQGQHGGQLVEHLHFHLLGGKNLGPKIIQE